jgi:predicted DNA-binding transcriptional regulator AlpA
MTLISFAATAARPDLSESTLRRMIVRGEFVDAVRVSPNRVAFAAAEVDTWLAGRPLRCAASTARAEAHQPAATSRSALKGNPHARQ